MLKITRCPSCGRKVPPQANFCRYCGSKIRETCNYCWVRKMDNYNCGESSCPGYGLFRLEKHKAEQLENELQEA